MEISDIACAQPGLSPGDIAWDSVPRIRRCAQPGLSPGDTLVEPPRRFSKKILKYKKGPWYCCYCWYWVSED